MAGGAPRQLVSPPGVVARQYGLLSVVEPRYDEPDQHWRNGVTWNQMCSAGGLLDGAQCGIDQQVKAANVFSRDFSASPFVAYVEIDCSPIGYEPAEQIQNAFDALTRVEEYQVEVAFWTGNVGATGAVGYVGPHLAANTAQTDATYIEGVTLQMAASVVTGAALDIVEGLGRLEAALGGCAIGSGVIHMTPAVADAAIAQLLIAPRNGVMYTVRGNKVAIGDGYPGTGPDGTLTPGVNWMYATPQIFAYRSAMTTVGGANFTEMFARNVNTAKIIAERVYVLGYGCCLFAVPISLGGNITGTYNAAN